MKNYTNNLKPFIYLNCWHKNKTVSTVVCNIYAGNNKGIAVQTNLKLLKECLDNSRCCHKDENVNSPTINTDNVKYINQEIFIEDFKSRNWDRNSFFKKCESYDYEREIRALFNLDYEDKKGFNFRKYIENDGIYIHIEPKELIEKIYVCSLAPDWVLDVVKSIAGKYEICEEKV